jgi:single-stranded DNA-binding protein
MESDINTFHGSGTVLDDATLKQLSNKKLVSNFYLKIQEVISTQTGTKKLRNILRIVGWDHLATHAATHAKSGCRVSIEGKLHVARWVGKTGVINVAYEIHLTEPIKLLQGSSEPLSSPLTPTLYPDRPSAGE